MNRISITVLAAFCLFASCTLADLSTRGARVVQTGTPPPQYCRNLGTVYGQGGGFGGKMVANNSLMEHAMNDALNKAGDLGATHLYAPQPPSLGGMGGSTTTATVMAYAYDCR